MIIKTVVYRPKIYLLANTAHFLVTSCSIGYIEIFITSLIIREKC